MKRPRQDGAESIDDVTGGRQRHVGNVYACAKNECIISIGYMTQQIRIQHAVGFLVSI